MCKKNPNECKAKIKCKRCKEKLAIKQKSDKLYLNDVDDLFEQQLFIININLSVKPIKLRTT